QGVADYVDDQWAHWLQSHRVELNAFTTPQFITWLDEKMAAFAGKVVPPDEVLAARLDDQVRQRVREEIERRALAQAEIQQQVDKAMAGLTKRLAEVAQDLRDRVAEDLDGDPYQHWAAAVDAQAESIAEESDDEED